MATKKAKAPAKAEPAKTAKKAVTDEEKKAKREAMKERLKNRAPGQRPNSKQCDIIELGGGKVVKTFAMNVRKFGVLLTSVVVDAEGNAIAVSNATIPGMSVKSKKEHGYLMAKTPGMGKNGKAEVAEEEEEDDEE